MRFSLHQACGACFHESSSIFTPLKYNKKSYTDRTGSNAPLFFPQRLPPTRQLRNLSSCASRNAASPRAIPGSSAPRCCDTEIGGAVRIANSMHFTAWRAPGTAPVLNRVLLSRLEAAASVIPAICPNPASMGSGCEPGLIWRLDSETSAIGTYTRARVVIPLLSGGVRWRLSPQPRSYSSVPLSALLDSPSEISMRAARPLPLT